MDKKGNVVDSAVTSLMAGAVMGIIDGGDGAASLQFPGGGKIRAIINEEGKPELQLIGPLSVGDLNIASEVEEEADAV